MDSLRYLKDAPAISAQAMCIEQFKKNEGSIIIEAAIILPLFILAMLSLATLIRMVDVEESLMNAYAKEAACIAKHAYADTASPIDRDIARRIKNAGCGPAKNICLENFNFFYQDRGIDGLISGDLCCDILIPLPLNFIRTSEFQERLLYRAFIGAECYGPSLGFECMEEKQESDIVYVFPKAGKRFHDRDCSYIAVCPTEATLSKRIKREFSPCKICRPEILPFGSKVYCFYRTGKAYHRGSCPLVDRYVIPMEKSDAIAKGYSPCQKCKGGKR